MSIDVETQRYHVEVVGDFAVTCRGRSVALGAATERLVALLASRGGNQSRRSAAGLLWPEATEARALANLRSAVYRIGLRAPGLVVSTGVRVLLDRSAATVDLQSASAACDRILAGVPSEDDLSPRMREVLSNDLLPSCGDLWAAEDREVFRQARLHALEALCRTLSRRGRHGEAVRAGLAAVRVEPLRESAQRALITAYLEESNYCEALHQYERFRVLLRDDLGIAPSPHLRDLVRVTPEPRPGRASRTEIRGDACVTP